jgi:DNA-binding transcriptional MerR regulator
MALNKMKIGEFADFLGLTASMIRYYEENGIIESKRDKASNYRYLMTPTV